STGTPASCSRRAVAKQTDSAPPGISAPNQGITKANFIGEDSQVRRHVHALYARGCNKMGRSIDQLKLARHLFPLCHSGSPSHIFSVDLSTSFSFPADQLRFPLCSIDARSQVDILILEILDELVEHGVELEVDAMLLKDMALHELANASLREKIDF